MRLKSWAIWPAALLAAGLFVGAIWTTYAIFERRGIVALREASAHRTEIYSSSLQAEMNRYEYLPAVLALNADVHRLLKNPRDTESQATVNRYLHTVNVQAGASAVYVMDTRGHTLAASNWQLPTSFVDKNFAYRPYFQDALRGYPGRFYGVGTVSLEAGYYFARSVPLEGDPLGVVAVKLSLEKLDQAWAYAGERIAVADAHGVIFLSSEPNWKYRTLRALPPATLRELLATRQYTEAGMLSPLGIGKATELKDGGSIVEIKAEPVERQAQRGDREYLVHQTRVTGTDWQMLVFSELTPARASARNMAALAAVSFVLLAVLGLYFQQRARSIRQSIAARRALESANDELERKVTERTEALSDANRHLQSEVVERQRAETALRAALSDLVHTAKMAALGQMSAGITHELNQPLAALRTLSANAIVYMDRGQIPEAKANLGVIVSVTDHMGKLTAQLKKFARKSKADIRPVDISAVVADVLFLLRQSVGARAEAIERQLEPGLRAMGDVNRLEQVLLNLLSNALDAIGDTPAGRVLLQAERDDEGVRIRVHDSGAGISPEVATRIFEPFFTTKDQGVGLGLGLTISADIVRDLGGTLDAAASERLGGAVFTVRLTAAAEDLVSA